MSRFTRLPTRDYKRMTAEQRRAADLLLYGSPGPAERGELKTVLRWKRTREETVAYARGLLDGGLGLMAVADRLQVGDRYLERLLERAGTGESCAAKPHGCAANLALTGEPKGIARSGGAGRENRPVCGGCLDCWERTAAVVEGARAA